MLIRAPTVHHMEDTPLVGSTIKGDSEPSNVKTRTDPAWRPPKSRIDRLAEAAALWCVRRHRRDEALRILMIAYGAHVTTFAFRIIQNRELANDVRQQVFLEAFQCIDQFQARSSLWSWLCSIAYHRCVDERRRLQKASASGNLETLQELVGPLDTTMDVDRAAKRRALEQCLGRLSPDLQAQLLMRYFFGLSHAEIGATVGAPHSTVQVRLSRVLPRLRQCLRGAGLAR
jgi:RNA polymerase sigma-70 factor (ECF subfamily)